MTHGIKAFEAVHGNTMPDKLNTCGKNLQIEILGLSVLWLSLLLRYIVRSSFAGLSG
jgi:hypothetical protein